LNNGLFVRSKQNPILTAKDWPYRVHSVMNPGAIRVNDDIILLVRCEDHRGISHLTVAKSKNGIDHWEIDPKPTIFPEPDKFPEERLGVEDARITHIPTDNKWIIAYTAVSINGALVSLAETRDFLKYKKLGAVLLPENKDAAVFPEKIDDKWIMINRPAPTQPDQKKNMWISYSDNMTDWSHHKLLFEAREFTYWDAHRIGLSSTPLKTPEGWLIMYHGVKYTMNGHIYRQSFALLDLKNPAKVLRRADEWILGPEELYEISGDVPNIVFSCGWCLDRSEEHLYVYYGAADTSIALATARLDDVMEYVMKMPKVEN